MTSRKGDLAFSLLVIAGCGVFGFIATGFENPLAMAGSQVPTQLFPILVLSFIALCSTLNAAKCLRSASVEGDADDRALSRDDLLRVALIVAVMVGCCLIWALFCFIAASVLLGPAIAAVMGVRAPLVHLGLAAFGPATWAVFEHVLKVSL